MSAVILHACLSFCAFCQGWTSTSWLVANTQLVPRHGSPVFTAAISHALASVVLLSAACSQNLLERRGPQQLLQAAQLVPHKAAFLGGLAWAFTLFMVLASAKLGVAEAQVLVVSGELLAAVAVDVRGGSRPWAQLLRQTVAPTVLALLGVGASVMEEFSPTGTGPLELLLTAIGAGACGVGLVVNSWGNSHMRQYLGSLNSSAWSASVATVGNAAIWLACRHWTGPFQLDGRSSTWGLWAVVGLASSFMVFVVTFVPGRIGFARTFCFIVAGKVSGGLLADASGFVIKRRRISASRVIGALAVLAGASLQKLQHEPPRSIGSIEVTQAAPYTRVGKALEQDKVSPAPGDLKTPPAA